MVLSLSSVLRFRYGGMGSSPTDSRISAKVTLGLFHSKSTQWLVPTIWRRVAVSVSCWPLMQNWRRSVPSFHFFRLPIMQSHEQWLVSWNISS